MILTILSLIILIIGIFLLILSNRKKYFYSDLDIFGFAAVSIGIVATLLCLCIIIITHIGIDNQIELNNIEYNSLCNRYEIIISEYEDVSKSDIIKDISEWNKNVISNKYWGHNPWTNWFYSKKVIENLKTIKYQ